MNATLETLRIMKSKVCKAEQGIVHVTGAALCSPVVGILPLLYSAKLSIEYAYAMIAGKSMDEATQKSCLAGKPSSELAFDYDCSAIASQLTLFEKIQLEPQAPKPDTKDETVHYD